MFFFCNFDKFKLKYLFKEQNFIKRNRFIVIFALTRYFINITYDYNNKPFFLY